MTYKEFKELKRNGYVYQFYPSINYLKWKAVLYGEGLNVILTRFTTEDEKSYDWRCMNFEPVIGSEILTAVNVYKRVISDAVSLNTTTAAATAYYAETIQPHLEDIVYNYLFDPDAVIVFSKDNDKIKFFSSDSITYKLDSTSIVFCVYNHVGMATKTTPYYIGIFDNQMVVMNHEFDIIPSDLLRGYGEYLDDSYSFIGMDCGSSLIESVLPLAVTASKDFSDFQAVKAVSSFPIREMTQLQCSHCGGTGMVDDATCSHCHGTGIMSIKNNPFTVLIRPKDIQGMESPKKMLEYITPPIEPLTFSWQQLQDQRRLIKNLLFVNDVDYNQSGFSKVVDKQNLDKFLHNLSQKVYDGTCKKILKECFNETISVTYPLTWVSATPQELQLEINATPQVNLRLGLVQDYIQTRFKSDKIEQRIQLFLSIFDPFYAYSEAELSGIPEYNTDQNMRIVHLFSQHYLKKLGTQVLTMTDYQLSEYLNEELKLVTEIEVTEEGVGQNANTNVNYYSQYNDESELEYEDSEDEDEEDD